MTTLPLHYPHSDTLSSFLFAGVLNMETLDLPIHEGHQKSIPATVFFFFFQYLAKTMNDPMPPSKA